MSALAVRAYAKINLTLEVLGRREDGPHEVATVIQAVALWDRLVFQESEAITLICLGMQAAPDNLILRAARLLREQTGARMGAAIVCRKRIPVASGLGGGSADAAATLRALNILWGTGIDPERLLELASVLGADVPSALVGGTALATDTGSKIQSLPTASPHWVVLVPLSAGVEDKTAEMYRALTPADFTDGAMARAQAAAIAAGRFEYGCISSAFNRLAAERWPETRAARAALAETPALGVSVAGSGPSAFALYGTRAAALQGLAAVRAEGLPARLVRFAPPEGRYTLSR